MADDLSHSSAAGVYFAPLLPWQARAWQQLTGQYHERHLPHGLLAAGQQGIGKRAFVWRFVAYLLCHHRSDDGACGQCQSCQWLKAGTHPDLMVLPESAGVGADGGEESIKIDDIRQLQEYSQTKGHGVKIIVLDYADTLTIGAANALLKTLEEPREGIFLLLISDNPARLLPTIKSRVQSLPLAHIEQAQALDYLGQFMPSEQAGLLLAISDGAVMQAKNLLDAAWFDKRLLWLKTFVALRTGMRLPTAASDYWQKTLSLSDFIGLSRLMLAELWRVYLVLPRLHTDIDTPKLLGDLPIHQNQLDNLLAVLDDVQLSVRQNLQEKLAFDKIMLQIATG
ncbi:DNA polymerase III subunit [Moraxella marmotae]|uniref:DNA polymerase III subunit n=1 Tax=Moraxella marmotae TaxID=3344520 RepID=UPI0035F3EC97